MKITREELIALGFKPVETFTVMKPLIYKVGRGRFISVGDINTPNEFAFLCELSPCDDKKISDLICIHNYDFDGYLTKEKVVNILNIFKGN